MKWIALLLLVLNLAYLGWQAERDGARARVSNAQSLRIGATVPALALLGELPDPPRERPVAAVDTGYSAGAEPVTDATGPGDTAGFDVGAGASPGELVNSLPDLATQVPGSGPVEYTCFTFGPLPDTQQVEWLSDWFRTRMLPITLRDGSAAGGTLLWVYLAPAQDENEARSMVAALEEKGVRDFRLISRGNLANAISLGLFSSQQAVNDRLNELRGKGFQPVVIPFEGTRDTRWIDVRIPRGDQVIEEMFAGFPARYNPVPAACTEIALDQSPQ